MGLDMYLEVETYIGRPSEWMKPEMREELTPNWNTLMKVLPGRPGEDAFGVTVSYPVVSWRKANHIHKWFVDNCQDGMDNCQRAYVSRDQLNELLSVCHEVVKAATLIDGKVPNGSHMGPDGEWIQDYAEGQVVAEPEVVAALLPTSEGFFFGDTDYNEWYLEDVQDTITQLDRVLHEYPEETGVSFYYQASW